jgi:hypothetical protein
MAFISANAVADGQHQIFFRKDSFIFEVAMIKNRAVIFDRTHEHLMHPTRRSPSQSTINFPVELVNPNCHAPIYDPGFRGLKTLLHHPCMLESSRALTPVQNHVGNCSCPDVALQFTMPALQNAVCLKSGLTATEPYALTDHVISYSFNKTKTFSLEGGATEVKKYLPLVPSPYLLNTEWEPRITFNPCLAFTPVRKRESLLLALNDVRFQTAISEWYSTPPHNWTNSSHPLFSEPVRESELSLWSEGLYGVESLNRVHFCAHPAAFGFHISLAKTDENLSAVEVKLAKANDIEMFVLEEHKKFIQEGLGSISCPSCVPTFSGSAPNIHQYTRGQFLDHYQTCHTQDLAFLGLATPSGLGQRLYETLILYISCLTVEKYSSSDDDIRFLAPRTSPYTRLTEKVLRNRPSQAAPPTLANVVRNSPPARTNNVRSPPPPSRVPAVPMPQVQVIPDLEQGLSLLETGSQGSSQGSSQGEPAPKEQRGRKK